jgi:CheY-like chemotaxis protein
MALILVVDDHPAMAGAVAALVRSEGHSAVVAYGGTEALDVLRARPVEVVVLDAMMPRMSGLDVLAAMETGDGGHRRTPPVIMYSGNDTSRERSLELGATAFVLKVDAHELLDRINAVAAPVPGRSGN